MGLILSIRRAMGLVGPEDGGLGSALRNFGQIERFGALVQQDPIESLARQEAAEVDPQALPWELRDDR